MEGTGHYFFFAFPVCLLILFILLKRCKVRFLIPSLLITLIIVNPWFYKYWEELGLYAYWRILWIVPVIPAVAGIVSAITEQTKNGFLKNVLATAGALAVVIGGTFVYSTTPGRFTIPATNIDKLPTSAVKVADRLLNLKEKPKVILQDPLGVYIRQYTGSINTLFGRDIEGYIYGASKNAKKINSIIGSQTKDFSEISQFMLDDEYDYLVMTVRETNDSLSLVDTVAGYGIYKAIGKPKVKKERNKLGQVLSETFIDENGKPINGEAGYSTIYHVFDKNGFITKEFRTNTEGNGVADYKGQAGYERTYDTLGNVLMERTLGIDGKPLINSIGYAEVRRKYEQKNLIWESYYNEFGQPVNRIDKQYAGVSFERDEKKHIIREQYWDTEGKAVICAEGYAEIRREYGAAYEGERLTREAFLGINGEPTYVKKGYTAVSRTYDQNGNVTSESYEDERGRLIDCINGYARVLQEYDENNKLIHQTYYNSKNHLVEIYKGYAEIYRIYNAQGRIIREEYYDANGWPKTLPAGYEVLEQDYNEAGELVGRRYLNSQFEHIIRTDGYSEVRWIFNEETDSYDIQFFSLDGVRISTDDKNLAIDIPGDDKNWSEWMIPEYNTDNSTIYIGTINLGEKKAGDVYTCQVEIEYKGVSATQGMPFRFWTQGSADGKWNIGNVWSMNLVNVQEPPQDGIYQYTISNHVNEKMEGITNFDIGFRCDYWGRGMFRVRKVQIEKGRTPNAWKPGI